MEDRAKGECKTNTGKSVEKKWHRIEHIWPKKARTIHLPKEMLVRMYVGEKKSMMDIAEDLHCSQDTVGKRLKEYGIKRRQVKKPIPKEKLLAMYEEEGYTIKELAAYFHCSHTTIGNRLHDLGVRSYIDKEEEGHVSDETILRAYKNGNSASFIAESTGISRWSILKRLRKYNVEIRQSHRKKFLPSKELQYLYNVAHLTTDEIGQLYGVKGCTISARLKELGCPIRGNRLSFSSHHMWEYYKNSGYSIAKTAKAFNCSYTAIRKRVERMLATVDGQKTKVGGTTFLEEKQSGEKDIH